jgi:tRNA modification GTPase
MITDETPVAAIATPLAQSALGAIRVSGHDSVRLLAARFSRPASLLNADGHTIHHGTIHDAEGCALDEVLVAVYRCPRSYTGEESAEIFCHGSPAGIRRVYAALLAAGFSAAEPGEFTRRAFSNGKLDLTRAEAVNEVVRAQTATAHALAVDRLSGRVEQIVGEIRAELVAIMAQLAIQLDYPEEDTGEIDVDSGRLAAAGRRVRELASTFARGRLYQDGARVVLAGRTNAGKSSLFNALLRQDRSIVSDVHGTTRDYVEALIDVEGVPVRLFDTAGLRATNEKVEEEGIRRSRAVVAAADLVLYAVDAAVGLEAEDESRLEEIRGQAPVIVVMNKIDLADAGNEAPVGGERAAVGPAPVASVRVSALTGAGTDELNRAILARLLEDRGADVVARGGDGFGAQSVVIDSERQHALLVRAAEAIEQTLDSLAAGIPADATAVDLQEALDAVGEITGEVASAEILDAMFGSFCVGK